MNHFVVLQQMVVILILVMGGFVCQRIGKVNETNKKFLSFLVVNIFNPALLISSVITNHEERDYTSVFVSFAMAIAMFAIFIIIGAFASRTQKEKSDRVTLNLMFIFSNLGFIGLPVIKNVLGDKYVIYNAIYNLVYNIVFYTYGISLTSTKKGFKLANLKGIFSIGTVGAVVAITLFFLNIRMPLIVEESVQYFGASCVPLALFMIGITLGEEKSLFGILKLKRNWIFVFVKMFIIPVVCAIGIKYLPIKEELKFLGLLMFAMPVGSLPLLLLAEKGWDCTFASNVTIMTTIVSVLSIPFVVFVYQFL
ncbi:AEC family transporter [Treponema pectinovorum]|uniref:AEC family transporter n=1 Tax=Treponema pectinovorum TaxID=164 RepID=UPI0011CCC5E8|nr:AEC family transporter [Treponema pectinovorum]